MKYKEELSKAMEMLGEHPKTIFIGQSVSVEGTAMFDTLRNVPVTKRLELPVAEEMQMGMANGLALAGQIPVSIFPRWNFLLLGTNQLVNHLDKLPTYSGYKTKVIIRTSIGSQSPLHPQCQHVGDFTEAFRAMLTTVDVIRLEEPEEIVPAYTLALQRDDGKSTILVEYGDYHNTK